MSNHPALRHGAATLACALAALLAGCEGGTPWGATPQQIPLPPLPRLEQLPAHIEAGTTAGAQRLAERVRAALAAEPRLAGATLDVQGFEGGVMVLSGRLPSAADRAGTVPAGQSFPKPVTRSAARNAATARKRTPIQTAPAASTARATAPGAFRARMRPAG